MSATDLEPLTAVNPATGSVLGRVPTTSPERVREAVARAREAQAEWAQTAWTVRSALLTRWWRVLAGQADAWASAIRDEIGKPRVEALAGDIVPTLDALRWTVRHGAAALRPERLGPGHQRLLQVPTGRLEYRPVGVVGMIGTWNYPLFLNAPPIAAALAAGNAVVWKPSERAPLVGQMLQQGLEESGLPPGLVAAVQGGAEVGQALVASEIDKGLFTGGVENGRRVLGALAARGIPAVAELSGFDPAIVLPDADPASTARNLAWAAFLGAGQTCVAVKRVYVVGDPRPLAGALAEQARSLRVGDPAGPEVDMGPLISTAARQQVHRRVREAVEAGASVLAGGEVPSGTGSFYPPTVLTASDAAPEAILAGIFGPVVVVRDVPDRDAAVSAANSGPYALAASVWSSDVRAARRLASRIEAGMVTINEAVAPTMHASAPFGGTRASGFGRTHGPLGLREFTYPQVVYARRAGGFRPQLFPYGAHPVEKLLGLYRRLFHNP